MTDGTAAAGAGDTLAPDELQLAFHEVECRTYDERFGLVFDQRSAARTAREVRRLVGARRWDRVVDVGCGTGHVGLGLAAAGLVDELHLLDLSAGMLGRATANAADLHVDPMAVRATAAALPYPDGAFDAVLTRGVLHHLHDPAAALTEWRRVVRRPGPVLLLSEPSPNADRVGGLAARTAMSGLAAARGIAGAVGRPLSRLDDEERTLQCYWDLVALAANLHTFTPAELGALGRAAGFGRGRVRAGGATSILWAVVYYVLAGELPALAGSRRARRVAREIWHVLRAVDRHGLDRALPARAGLTVQAVFWDPA